MIWVSVVEKEVCSLSFSSPMSCRHRQWRHSGQLCLARGPGPIARNAKCHSISICLSVYPSIYPSIICGQFSYWLHWPNLSFQKEKSKVAGRGKVRFASKVIIRNNKVCRHWQKADWGRKVSREAAAHSCAIFQKAWEIVIPHLRVCHGSVWAEPVFSV